MFGIYWRRVWTETVWWLDLTDPDPSPYFSSIYATGRTYQAYIRRQTTDTCTTSSVVHYSASWQCLLHCALAAAQCIVIGPVCGFVCGSVTTITRNCVHRSSPKWVCRWLNFGRPAPPERGLRRGEKFRLRLTTASAQCLRLIWAFFHCSCTYVCVVAVWRQSSSDAALYRRSFTCFQPHVTDNLYEHKNRRHAYNCQCIIDTYTLCLLAVFAACVLPPTRRLCFHRRQSVSLFVCLRITQKPLDRFSQNSVERWHISHGRNV